MTETPASPPEQATETSLEDRADELAQRFSKSDWIELAAAVLLALATIMAAWSAYQATRWGGVQANSYSAASAARTEATQATNLYASQAQIDVQSWLTWLAQKSSGNDAGTTFLYERFRAEFRPAFDAWLAQVPAGQIPPGTPFDRPEYQPAERIHAQELNDQADAFAADARQANQRGDNFVLTAVIMASAMFFAGVGTKFQGRRVRIIMLTLGVLLLLGGVLFAFSMPQNVGI